MRYKLKSPAEILSGSRRCVYFKTTDPHDFSIINWETLHSYEGLTKEELFNKYDVKRGKTTVGEFVFNVLLNSDFVLDAWHMVTYSYEYKVLNHQHVFIYRLYYNRKRKKNWRNPLQIFGIK